MKYFQSFSTPDKPQFFTYIAFKADTPEIAKDVGDRFVQWQLSFIADPVPSDPECYLLTEKEAATWSHPETRSPVFNEQVGNIHYLNYLEDVVRCPKCESERVEFIGGGTGTQSNGLEADVAAYQCLTCGHQWSD